MNALNAGYPKDTEKQLVEFIYILINREYITDADSIWSMMKWVTKDSDLEK